MQSSNGARELWKWLGVGIGAVGAVALLWKFLPLGQWLVGGAAAISAFGWAAIPVFILVYLLLSLCGFPATPLNVAAGIMFGYATGVGTAMVAAFTAAMATFLIARYVARDWVRRRIESNQKACAVLDMLEDGGFKIVLLARLNPFIPAIVKSYAFGVTPIPLHKYALATVLGQFPVLLAHVYLGWAGLAMLDGTTASGPAHTVLLIAGVVVSIVLLLVISWYGHKHLRGSAADQASPDSPAADPAI